VQTIVLLLGRVPESSVEEAQEDVQGADNPSRNRGRPPRIAQGYCPPKYVHTEVWGWRWTNQRCAGVPVARSSILITLNHRLKFCYFWKLAGSHRSRFWKGVLRPAPSSYTPRGVSITRGDQGAGLQWGGDAGEDV